MLFGSTCVCIRAAPASPLTQCSKFAEPPKGTRASVDPLRLTWRAKTEWLSKCSLFPTHRFVHSLKTRPDKMGLKIQNQFSPLHGWLYAQHKLYIPFTLSINFIFLLVALRVFPLMAADSPLSLAQTPFPIPLTLHPSRHPLHSSPMQSCTVVKIKEHHQLCEQARDIPSEFTVAMEGVGHHNLCLVETPRQAGAGRL